MITSADEGQGFTVENELSNISGALLGVQVGDHCHRFLCVFVYEGGLNEKRRTFVD